jgi:hypothetical protein
MVTAVVDGDVGTIRRETQRNGAPDPPPAAAYERNAS